MNEDRENVVCGLLIQMVAVDVESIVQAIRRT